MAADRYLDVTGVLSPAMWSYKASVPDIPPFEQRRWATVLERGWEADWFAMPTLAGTYLETGKHLDPSVISIDQVPVDRLFCDALIARIPKSAREHITAADLEPFGDEFALSGLTPRACRRIAAPFVAESPVHMELETVEVRRFAPGVPDGGNLVIGRIVHMRIDDGLLDREGRFDPAAFDAVGRMGGLAYCTTRGRFDLPRGRAALAAPEPPHAPS